jgi:adenosylcobyric acid synthase
VSGTTSGGVAFSGYEMHIGVTRGPALTRPFAHLADGTPEGAISADGRVIGTYIHGLFADDRQRAAWLGGFAAGPSQVAYEAQVERTLDALAAHLGAHLDLDRVLTLAR